MVFAPDKRPKLFLEDSHLLGAVHAVNLELLLFDVHG